MELFSHHTHSHFCDGKLSPEEYVKKAIGSGLSYIGFSSHAPFDDAVSWTMNDALIDDYVTEIDRLKEFYKEEIDIYRSLEIDYIPGLTRSFSYWKKRAALDYTIGSVHLIKGNSVQDLMFLDGPDTNFTYGLQRIFGNDIKQAVKAYYHQINEMIEEEAPDIAGHIDKIKMNNKERFFQEDEKWYRDLQNETLCLLEQTRTIVEVNTRGIYKKKSKELFPDSYFLTECCRREIPVTISSDAHHPQELLLGYQEVCQKLKRIGFGEIMKFSKGEWLEKSLL